jgi:hypothetical protein
MAQPPTERIAAGDGQLIEPASQSSFVCDVERCRRCVRERAAGNRARVRRRGSGRSSEHAAARSGGRAPSLAAKASDA